MEEYKNAVFNPPSRAELEPRVRFKKVFISYRLNRSRETQMHCLGIKNIIRLWRINNLRKS
jgi:hypothetical protein